MRHRCLPVASVILAMQMFLPAGLTQQKPVYAPKVSGASDRAAKAMSAMTVDPGFRLGLFAAEPDVANIVCLWIDDLGRVYVGESFRQAEKGIPDNRDHGEWLLDDLRSETVADRRAMYLTHHPHMATSYTKEHDRIRLLVDTDGDQVADRVTTFADGFNDILDGTGAGLLSRGRDVYYTCIPNLWKLTDVNADGVADRREILSHGYGVRIALRGHDSHGLVIGPDGRLYFSIGDRGFSITTREGRRLHLPYTGAVFRCELDGSNLELFATGLRNPQELAFDDFGNLFTCDNNSDSEDKARVLYVVEGGETGWRMNFQYRSDRGGWVSEGWWKPRFEGQAAFLIPPLANLGNGPSGFAHYPGTGLPARYQNTFFLCDFLGSRSHSGIRAFRLEPDGAGFKLGENWKFLWNVLATDVGFRPDGSLLVSDWVFGWVGEGSGALYTVATDDAEARSQGQETAKILATSNFDSLTTTELCKHLRHQDRRVRLEAQFAFAKRSGPELRNLALVEEHQLARLHAIWGLSQRARQYKDGGEIPELLPLLLHSDPETRAQTIRALGEYGSRPVLPNLIAALKDPSTRVQYFAAMALGHFPGEEVLEPLLELARSNSDRDLYLRHAVVMALSRTQTSERILQATKEGTDAERLVGVLVLRRLGDRRVSDYLADPSVLIADEAARALYDRPIPFGHSVLAKRLLAEGRGIPFLRRAVAGADLTRRPEFLPGLWELAQHQERPASIRHEALEVLLGWNKPGDTDRILNMAWSRSAGSSQDVVATISHSFSEALRSADDKGRGLLARIAAEYRIPAGKDLQNVVAKADASDDTRLAALRALRTLQAEEFEAALQSAYASGRGKLRAAASDLLSTLDPERALRILDEALRTGGLRERQQAYRTLGRMGDERATALLITAMNDYLEGSLEPAVQLDVVTAARERAKRSGGAVLASHLQAWDARFPSGPDPMASRLLALEGGDAELGRKIFRDKTEVSCRRCHAVGDEGATDRGVLAGPNLLGIGSRKDRTYLLRSLLQPSADLSPGFAEIMVETSEQDIYRGRVVSETETELILDTVEVGQIERVTVQKSLIVHRQTEKSSMPEDVAEKLSLSELRDLVEYLSSLRDP